MIKNILFFNDFGYINGGASKVAIDTAIGLSIKGYKIIFICGIGPVCEELKNTPIKTICISENTDWKSNLLESAIKAIWNKSLYEIGINELKDINPSETIACVHYISKILSPSVFKLLNDLNIKGIFTLHSYYTCPNEASYNYRKGKICTLKPMSTKCILCNCDVRNYFQKIYRCFRQLSINYNIKRYSHLSYFAVSNMEREIILKHNNKHLNKIGVLYNPVDIYKGEKIRISQNTNYIFIGRLSEEKGITDFCKAMQELDLNGIVLGDGKLLNSLRNQYPNVRFEGWIDSKDMKTYYKQAKCLVFPSKVPETFGLSIVEALSYGIPCIVPSKCGAVDVINDGGNGFVYEIGSYNSLINCIKKFESSDLKFMENFISKDNNPYNFSINKYIQNYECILKKL